MTEFKYHNMAVDENRFVFCNTPLEAVDGAHALVVLTEWDEFKVYPYQEFYAKMKKEDAMTEFKYHNMAVDENKFVFCSSPLEAVDGAHALVVLTEWDEFKVYPYEEFYAKMMKPACVFDGRGILN